MAGVTQYRTFRVIPIPIKHEGMPRAGEVDFHGVEKLLDAMSKEGWSVQYPIDFSQPALVFSRAVLRDVDKQIETVLSRLEEGRFEIWAPEIAPLDPGIPDLIHEWLTDEQLGRTIRAVLAVSS